MADIFLSYKKTDRERVAPIVALLDSCGWSVWWDTRIDAGEKWDEVIEREVNAASCVVAVWSFESVSSRWVRTEASEGLERGILVPVFIDPTKPPLEFKLVQSIYMVGWRGDASDPAGRTLVGAVERFLGQAPTSAGPLAPERQVPDQERLVREQEHWELIRKSRDPRQFSAFLAAYPSGRHARAAMARIEQLTLRAERVKSMQLATLLFVMVSLTVSWAVLWPAWFGGQQTKSPMVTLPATPVVQPQRSDTDDPKAAAARAAARRRLAEKRLEERKKQQAAVAVPPQAAPPAALPVVNVPARAAAPLTPGEERALKPKDSFRECDECPEMVVVPAGSFMMGSPANEAGRDANEGPQRRVTIGRPFAVGKFEVAFAEWDGCIAAGGCNHRPDDRGWGRGRRPVINVSWHDAKDYVAWLSRKTGKSYRLLSGAEWEYAARAGTTTRHAFGDTITASQAKYGGGRTVEVGSFPANKFGLHDMHGNVWEWVEDNWHPNYEGAAIDGSAWPGGDASLRVLRGGSWSSNPDYLRSAKRLRSPPGLRDSLFGLRLARTLYQAVEAERQRVAIQEFKSENEARFALLQDKEVNGRTRVYSGEKTDLNGCAERCLVDTSCQAFSFNRTSELCYLIDHPISQTIDPSFISAIARAWLPPPKPGAVVSTPRPEAYRYGPEVERAWAAVRGSTSIAALEAFRREYGPANAVYDRLAEARIEELRQAEKRLEEWKKRQAAAAVPPPRAAAPLTPAEERRLSSKDSFSECDECPEMVVVPAGEFTMGSPASEAGLASDEGPQRNVAIARPFAVGKFEVTFSEWDACVAAGGCIAPWPSDRGWGRGRRPVINVSWDQITKDYLPWLSRQTGKTYRLLTEAEWEYAARAGTTTPFSTGRLITPEEANGSFTYGGDRKGVDRQMTLEVGSFKPNAFGLHDMHGNVWEWVQDCYQSSYTRAPIDGSAVAYRWATFDCNRVLRGGSWDTYPSSLRSANRGKDPQNFRSPSSGFRVARTLAP